MRRVKRWIAAALTSVMCVSLMACGGKSDSKTSKKEPDKSDSKVSADFTGVELEVAVTYTGDAAAVFQEICDEFSSQTGCTVVVDAYGQDYTNMMTNRMAVNDMPDVYETSGWSLKRFKEYSLELTDEPYVADYSDSAVSVVQDTDGKYYACMISCGYNCMAVNLSVVEKAGVDLLAIHTWDDFLAACQKIKDAGFTAIGSAPNAGLTSNIAGSFLVYKGEAADVGEEILNGTWDWKEYQLIIDFWKKALSSGYCFSDAKSMNADNKYERFGSGQSAFLVSEGFDAIQEAQKVNPDGKFAMAPFPASKEGGEETVATGEGDSFGIWKESESVECAKEFLRYLATSDVTMKLISETGRCASIKTTEAKDDSSAAMAIKELKEKYKDHNIAIYNTFNREYFPDHLWGRLGTAANKIFANYNNDEKMSQLIDDLKKEYDRYWQEEHKAQ